MRLAVKAVVLDGDAVVLFRRVKPGLAPYWAAPGGGVEPGEDERSALGREVAEELGAEIEILEPAFEFEDEVGRYTAYLCRLVGRTGEPTAPEFAEPARGSYEEQRIPLTRAALEPLNVWPPQLKEYLLGRAR